MATDKRDLHSGTSVWRPVEIETKQLDRDLNVDVLVIGAGATGALIAETLSGHFSVAVVDRRSAAKGSTVASTGLLLFEIDTPLIELRKKIGGERADRAWRRSDRSMRALFERIERLGIDCDLIARESVYLPSNLLDASGLREEAQERARCGLPSRAIGRAELHDRFGISREAAIVSGNSAEVNPPLFAAGFLRCAEARGARIYADVEISRLDSGPKGACAITAEGARIEARFIVFATGYEIPDYVSVSGQEVHSTWAMATVAQAAEPWSGGALIWEAGDPYTYMRTTSDRRVLVGGGDEDFDDAEKRTALTPRKVEALRSRLEELFPALDSAVDFAWSGAFGSSSTGLPSIGAIPGMPHCYAVLGFGGNGMTYAMIAAQILEQQLLGKPDPDADLFAFPPLPVWRSLLGRMLSSLRVSRAAE